MNRTKLFKRIAWTAGGALLGVAVIGALWVEREHWRWIVAGLLVVGGSLILQAMLMLNRRVWRYCPTCRRWVSQFGEAMLLPVPGDKRETEHSVCAFCQHPTN